jgi:lipopolysaccharide transport system ATP-binding protein
MNNGVVLTIEGLYKKFCRTLKRSMYYGTIDITRNMLGIPYNTAKLRKDEFWALENINLELKKGETLGLVGQNGSGKTTLLRLINGIFPPDKGRITVIGRIGALISLGAGFHPHMTGRENIFINGTILGMNGKEIKQKLDSIVDFADIGDFLDAPINTYSSGMTVRLGFAIAIHTVPDILLIDEILAVGDISFKGKCYNKMRELQGKGVAIILVSHDTQTILDNCTRAILFDCGKIPYTGSVSYILSKYEELLSIKAITKIEGSKSLVDLPMKNPLQLSLSFLDKYENNIESIGNGEPFYIVITIDSDYELEKLFLTIHIKTTDGYLLSHIRNDYFGIPYIRINKGQNIVKVFLRRLDLEPGSYIIDITAINGSNEKPFMNTKFTLFNIIGTKKSSGLINADVEWLI